MNIIPETKNKGLQEEKHAQHTCEKKTKRASDEDKCHREQKIKFGDNKLMEQYSKWNNLE